MLSVDFVVETIYTRGAEVGSEYVHCVEYSSKSECK